MPQGVCSSGDGRIVSDCVMLCMSAQMLTELRRCTLQADRGRKIGWSPQYSAKHILEDAENEVQLILHNI